MRYFVLMLLTIACTAAASAQALDSLAHSKMRDMALAMYPAQRSVMSELFAQHDSMPTKSKALIARYDSLTKDSVFLSSPVSRVVRVDAALSKMRKGFALKFYAELKSAYTALDVVEDFSEYKLEVASYLQGLAVEANDYSTAYALQNMLHAAMYAQWQTESKLLIDSISEVQASALKEQAIASAEHKKELESWSQLKWIGLVLIGLLAIVVAVLVYASTQSKKKLNRALQQAGDTSEKETLVMKLEAARQEVTALKVAARKHVEVPIAESTAQSSEVGASIDSAQVQHWNEEIQQGLAKIKAHCEAGKNSMSVPTYMSIVNDTSRLSSQVMKRAQEWVNNNSTK